MTTRVAAKAHSNSDDRAVGLWLLVCSGMILAMAVIGAITRLTESGLSIMEWAPVVGTLPPLNEAEWQRVFALYRQIPEYQQVNAGMSLEEFKTIFWWEYIHRLWGRLIGVVFAVPFVWFLIRGKLRRELIPHLVAMFLLGGLQGGLGWYMVAKRLCRPDRRQPIPPDRTSAACHRDLRLHPLGRAAPAGARAACFASCELSGLRRSVIGLIGLLLITIASGGFVAG